MTKKTFILIAIASCAWIGAGQSSFAATIPAGTTLVVRTLNTIHSTDRVGRTFTAQLDQDVAVNGKVVLPKGTKVSGKIEASQVNPRNSQPLTLNITDISANGRTIPIKTSGGFVIENVARTGRARTRGITVGPYVAPHGTKMQFRLAQPLNV
jgi:hypothetical protein